MNDVQAMATALIENGYGTTTPGKDASDVLLAFWRLRDHYVCDVIECDEGFVTLEECIAHERTHRVAGGEGSPAERNDDV